LGSITQISDNSGNLAAEYSYDAWGRQRNPANWQVYAQGSQLAMPHGERGYTGHEQLNQFGLINLNARLYDPLLARFLAPDPYVSSDQSNDFNRYIYCRNNPMMYTDPSGKTWNSFWSGVGNFIKKIFPGGLQVGYGAGIDGSSSGFFYNGSNGNSGIYGNYNLSTSTFTMGSTYNGYQTGFYEYGQHGDPITYQMNTATQAYMQENAENNGFQNSWSETINNTANILGPTDFSFNESLKTFSNASNAAKGGGAGLSILATGLTGYQVYDQFHTGGLMNVNPVDATSVLAGITAMWSKVMIRFGLGGELTSSFAEAIDFITYPILIYQSWYNVYKPMNDLRFAPSYYDTDGQPFYGDQFTNDQFTSTGEHY